MRLKPMLALLLAFLPAAASTTWTSASQTSITSLTVSGSTHNLGSPHFGVRTYNTSGILQPTSGYTYTINQSTYDVTITWSPSAFSGTVKLTGVFNATTTAGTDFQPALDGFAGGVYHTVAVCQQCSDSVPAVRSVNGVGYVGLGNAYTTYGSGTFTLRVYITPDDHKVIFASDQSPSNSNLTCGGGTVCDVRYSITAFPSNAFKIAHATASGGYSSLVDDRGF